MALEVTLETTDTIAKITLSGELDASTAGELREKVEAAAGHHPKCLVLMMQDLNYMASAGLRVLIFAKQKMGSGVKIYMIGTQDTVLDTLQKTGFDQSVYLLDEYDASVIES